jgi:hypothetical protein
MAADIPGAARHENRHLGSLQYIPAAIFSKTRGELEEITYQKAISLAIKLVFLNLSFGNYVAKWFS